MDANNYTRQSYFIPPIERKKKGEGRGKEKNTVNGDWPSVRLHAPFPEEKRKRGGGKEEIPGNKRTSSPEMQPTPTLSTFSEERERGEGRREGERGRRSRAGPNMLTIAAIDENACSFQKGGGEG